MAEEEKKPLKHFKFEGFSEIEGSLTSNEIRELYKRRIKEYKENQENNKRVLASVKAEKEATTKEFDAQKNELGRDPQIFQIRMKQRYDSEKAYLEHSYADKTNPQYIKLSAALENLYAHALDKDLLAKDQNAYVNKVMDTLEVKTAQINTEIKKEESRVNLENRKLDNQTAIIGEQQKVLEANPECYAKLFAIKSGSQTHDDPHNDPATNISLNAKGKPCLSVVLKDARFPGGFVISDGKVNFSQGVIDNMTLDTMRYIIDYLERHGIKGIELPDEIDKKLQDQYEQALTAKQADEEAQWNKYNTNEDVPIEENKHQPNPDRKAEEHSGAGSDSHTPASGFANQPAQDLSSPPSNHEETVVGAQTVDYGKLVNNIDDWVFGKGGMNKQEYWNGFKSFKWSGGWNCWTVYDDGNFRNDELDNKLDKNGSIKSGYSFKIYSRKIKDTDGNEKLEIRYAMPKGKNISQGYANGVTRMLKKCGMTYVNFPDGLPEEDESAFRIACAGNGLIPMLGNLSENKVNKMLDEAKNKLSDKDLLNYKRKLADWMDECVTKEGAVFEDHKNASLINNLRGEYQAQPFRDMYEKGGGICTKLTEIVKQNEDNLGKKTKEGSNELDYSGAIKIAAAADTVAMLFEVYTSNHDKTVEDMLKDSRLSAAPFDKQEIIDGMAANLRKLDPPMDFPANKQVRDLKPREMAAFYEALIPGNERKYAKEFDDEIIRAQKEEKAGLPLTKDAVITKRILDKARQHFSSVSSNLEENYNVKKIYLPNLGLPQHDFIENRERLIASGAIERPKPKKTRGRRGYDNDFDDDEFEM